MRNAGIQARKHWRQARQAAVVAAFGSDVRTIEGKAQFQSQTRQVLRHLLFARQYEEEDARKAA